jgi:subtilisin family serine protease
MAPQASLYLLMIGDSVDLQNATNYCITNGIDIINHSVGWYNTNYYDGTGTVAGIANNARDNGILWVNAAGNEASDGHWQGDFVDTDSDGYHEFGSGDDYLDEDGRDEGSRIYATSGDTVVIYMSWDDWAAWDQDYDLHLYDSGGTPVASSIGWQNGQSPPTEAIFYDVTSTGYYEIVIQAYDAPQKPEIEFFAYRDSGADTESFSSQGPSNASKHSASITKPDICGPDGASNYTYNFFYGTSAASPHVAGAAALLLSENPTRTADQLQAKLEGDAIDMGTAGKDNLYGSGRLNLAPGGGTAAVFRVDKTGNVYADGAYYGAGFYTGSADVAEWVSVSEPVEPGDVLELDPDHAGHYRKSRGPCSTLVAGVVSTEPGFVLGTNPSTLDFGPWTDDSRPSTVDSALIALLGIVPMKVTDEGGPIEPGDLLTTSSTPGYAMKWNQEDGTACGLVGKALEPLDSGTGVIKSLLMR